MLQKWLSEIQKLISALWKCKQTHWHRLMQWYRSILSLWLCISAPQWHHQLKAMAQMRPVAVVSSGWLRREAREERREAIYCWRGPYPRTCLPASLITREERMHGWRPEACQACIPLPLGYKPPSASVQRRLWRKYISCAEATELKHRPYHALISILQRKLRNICRRSYYHIFATEEVEKLTTILWETLERSMQREINDGAVGSMWRKRKRNESQRNAAKAMALIWRYESCGNAKQYAEAQADKQAKMWRRRLKRKQSLCEKIAEEMK